MCQRQKCPGDKEVCLGGEKNKENTKFVMVQPARTSGRGASFHWML